MILIIFILLNLFFLFFFKTEFIFLNILFCILLSIFSIMIKKHIVNKSNLAISSLIIFNYFFFFLAPLIQFNSFSPLDLRLVNTLNFEIEYAYKAIISVIVFNLIILIFYLNQQNQISNTIIQKPITNLDSLNFNIFKKVSFLMLLITIILIPFVIDYYFNKVEDSFSKSISLIITKYLFFIPVFPFFFYLIYRKNVSAILIFITFVILILFKNPLIEKRNAIGPIYMMICTILFPSLKNSNVKSLVFLFLIMIIFFPLITIITHEKDTIKSFGFIYLLNSFDIKNYLIIFYNSLHYDAFVNIMAAIKYFETHELNLGFRLLGAILFFVPRSIWPNKPLSSGEEVANYLIDQNYMWFNNLSQPIIGEGWLNFGFFGVIIFAYLLVIILKFADKFSLSIKAEDQILYLYYSYYMFFFLRGDLMNGIAYFIGPMLAFYITPKALSYFVKYK